jgi:hypothetical protein
MSEEYFYNVVNGIYVQMGALFDTTANYRNVLGIRKVTLSIKGLNEKGVYDDRIWVVWLDKAGVKHATEYEANTEPMYRYEKKDQGNDANEDGKNDLGRLRQGVYKYFAYLQWSKQLGRLAFKLTEAQWADRDINEDGYFDENDLVLITNIKAMMEEKTMHIHQGGKNDTWSAGCQTLPPLTWKKFERDILDGNKAGQLEFTYVLVHQA